MGLSTPRFSTESVHESEEAPLTAHEWNADHHCFGCSCKKNSPASWKVALPWFLVLLLFVALVIVIAGDFRNGNTLSTGSSLYWRESDFSTAKDELPATYQQVRFDAKLRYNESHQLYRPASSPDYVGKPSPEIDDAWADILGVVQIFVTPDEGRLLDGDLWPDSETGLPMATVTVFHDLHCLNMIRKALHPEYYTEIIIEPSMWPHLEHCIDSLRLSLMCSADTTLIPVEWSVDRNWVMPKFETVHTCRDYAGIKDWATARDSVDEDTFRDNAAKLSAKAGLTPRSGGLFRTTYSEYH